MEITVQLPKDDSIDFNRICYAYIVTGVTTCRIIGVGLTVEEARQSILDKYRYNKDTYQSLRHKYLSQADLGVMSPDKFHRGRYYTIMECDMQCYLYTKEKNRGVTFIFDGEHDPPRIKFERKTNV